MMISSAKASPQTCIFAGTRGFTKILTGINLVHAFVVPAHMVLYTLHKLFQNFHQHLFFGCQPG